MAPPLIVAAAFIAFAVVHSVTTSDRFKSFVGRITGEGWVRTYYRAVYSVLSAVTALVGTYVALGQPETPLYRPDWPVLLVFHLVQFFGLWLIIIAAQRTGIGYFLGVAQMQGHAGKAAAVLDAEGSPRVLYTSGIYALVRHPMYLGGILAFLPEPNIGLNCLVLRTLATAYFVYGAVMEEKRCVKMFGEEYLEYRKHVPMFNIVAGLIRAHHRQRSLPK